MQKNSLNNKKCHNNKYLTNMEVELKNMDVFVKVNAIS